jgi:hypothetical protein
MSISESQAQRLSSLFDDIAHHRAYRDEVIKELSALHGELQGYKRGKVKRAIEWAEIYYSDRRWKKWGSQDRVRGFLLNSIYCARNFEMD